MEPLNLSPCLYLFGRDSEEVFANIKVTKQMIEEGLATLMKVSAYLISQKGAFILFDPTAFNNQCHLYALMTAKKVEKVDQIDDRYVHLSFLLSYSILTDASLLGKIVKKVPKEIRGELPQPEKEFEIFLKDPHGERTRAARLALNKLFKAYIASNVDSQHNPVYEELKRLAKDPQLYVSYGPEKLYTLPKFAGVVYFIHALARQRIPLIFKIKVMTKEGTGFFQHSDDDLKELSQESPIIVFEMIAYDESLTKGKCVEIAKKCPRSSERNVKRIKRHDEKENCFFCNPQRVDIDSYQKKYLPILKKGYDILYGLGVDFIQERQPEFLKFFTDTIEYPLLTETFQAHAPNVEKFGLSSMKASNIYVSHVFVDSVLRASHESMIMNASYDKHLLARGLI